MQQRESNYTDAGPIIDDSEAERRSRREASGRGSSVAGVEGDVEAEEGNVGSSAEERRRLRQALQQQILDGMQVRLDPDLDPRVRL